MIEEFVKAWNHNKTMLEEYFKTTEMGVYSDYNTLVKLLFEKVINPYRKTLKYKEPYDLSRLHVIDDGDYQGTIIYLIPESWFQPNSFDYVWTCVEYGSCSTCDTIKGICEGDEDELPNEQQLKNFMTLCLHLLQHCKKLDTKE